MRGRLVQCKQVARHAHLQRATDGDGLVHSARTTARRRVQVHGQLVAMALRGIVAQRIGARQATRQLQLQVRPRGELRQFAAAGRLEFEQDDGIGNQPLVDNVKVQGRAHGQ